MEKWRKEEQRGEVAVKGGGKRREGEEESKVDRDKRDEGREMAKDKRYDRDSAHGPKYPPCLTKPFWSDVSMTPAPLTLLRRYFGSFFFRKSIES